LSHYRISGNDFNFAYQTPELLSFINSAMEMERNLTNPFPFYSFPEDEYLKLVSVAEGWMVDTRRMIEVYESPKGYSLRVEGCSGFFITVHGETIHKQDSQKELSQLDREVLLGPALVLALTLRNVWSLHASAAMYKDNVFVFLGESGLGKSTLAGYLSKCPGWRLVADDILPVKMEGDELNALPHFPQLKFPMDAQPGVDLPEHLPLKNICVLEYADSAQMPALLRMTTGQGVQALLGHIAGTRMFSPDLLTKHLRFSTQAAKHVPAYRIIYPHRRDALPLVRDFLETIC
jgi:hypothetical protein